MEEDSWVKSPKGSGRKRINIDGFEEAAIQSKDMQDSLLEAS